MLLLQKDAANDSDLDSEEEDEKAHKRQVTMMKKHAQQRIEVIQGDKLSMDDEVEEVGK